MQQEMEPFSVWLRRRMQECGYQSASELARASRVTPSTLSRLFSGATGLPSGESLRRVSVPLRTPMLELLVRAGYLSPEEANIPTSAFRPRTRSRWWEDARTWVHTVTGIPEWQRRQFEAQLDGLQDAYTRSTTTALHPAGGEGNPQ